MIELYLLLVSALVSLYMTLYSLSLIFRLNNKETSKAIPVRDDNRLSTIGMSYQVGGKTVDTSALYKTS